MSTLPAPIGNVDDDPEMVTCSTIEAVLAFMVVLNTDRRTAGTVKLPPAVCLEPDPVPPPQAAATTATASNTATDLTLSQLVIHRPNPVAPISVPIGLSRAATTSRIARQVTSIVGPVERIVCVGVGGIRRIRQRIGIGIAPSSRVPRCVTGIV